MRNFARLEGQNDPPINTKCRKNNVNGESPDLQNQMNPSNISPLSESESIAQGLKPTEGQNIVDDINTNEVNQNVEDNLQAIENQETTNSREELINGEGYDESREEIPRRQKRKAHENFEGESSCKKIRSVDREQGSEIIGLSNPQEGQNSENLGELENEIRGVDRDFHVANMDANTTDSKNSKKGGSSYFASQGSNDVEARRNKAESGEEMLAKTGEPPKENYEVRKSQINPPTNNSLELGKAVLPFGIINPSLSRDVKGSELITMEANPGDKINKGSTEEILKSTEGQNDIIDEHITNFSRAKAKSEMGRTREKLYIGEDIANTGPTNRKIQQSEEMISPTEGCLIHRRSDVQDGTTDSRHEGQDAWATIAIEGLTYMRSDVQDAWATSHAEGCLIYRPSDPDGTTRSCHEGRHMWRTSYAQDAWATNHAGRWLTYMRSDVQQDPWITSYEGEVISTLVRDQHKSSHKLNKSTHSFISDLFLFALNFVILYNFFIAISYFAGLAFTAGNIDFSSKLLNSFMRTISFAGIFISFPFRGLRRFVALRFWITKEPKPDRNTSFLSLIYEAIESVISSKI